LTCCSIFTRWGVINSWKLKGKSVGSESNSDGIFFEDNEGNVVHLSGHYVYIETKNIEVSIHSANKRSKR